MRSRSSFRARRPAKAANLAYFARKAFVDFRDRMKRREKALKNPKAKALAAERVQRSFAEQGRKRAKRAESYRRGEANYHPVARAAAEAAHQAQMAAINAPAPAKPRARKPKATADV